MTMDERQRNFKAAKQEVKQQQAAEAEQEESTARERNFKAMEEFVANKQLTDIFKGIEKLGKQNETLQKKMTESLQINLQHEPYPFVKTLTFSFLFCIKTILLAYKKT